jgi:predicted PurR-regulated permease PerM
MNLNVSTATRWGLNALILLGLVLALWMGQTILIPTVISLLLAAMLWPGVAYLNRVGFPVPFLGTCARYPWLVPCVYRLKIPWSIACSAAVGFLVTLALVIALGFGIAIPKMLQSLPNDPEKTQAYYDRFRERVQRVTPVPIDPQYLPEKADDSAIVQYLHGALDPKTSNFIFNTLLHLASYGGTWAWESILIMFILLFLLLEGRMLSRHLVEIFGPSPTVQTKVLEALADMAMQIRAYLVWRTIINFGLALVLGIIYYLLGLSQPWTWALFTAILWYVPYLGPILAGIPPVLDAFVSCESPWVSVILLFFYIFFVTIEGYFIVPVVMGRSMSLNATTVMLACLFWELVWGPAGLFLAMPLMAAVKSICEHVPDWQPWANLMGNEETPRVEAASDGMLDDTQVMTSADLDAAIALRESKKALEITQSEGSE